MKVSELISKLQSFPQETEVIFLYDLGCHNNTDHVWLGRNGTVYMTQKGEWISDEDKWPEGVQANFKEPYGHRVEDWTPDRE